MVSSPHFEFIMHRTPALAAPNLPSLCACLPEVFKQQRWPVAPQHYMPVVQAYLDEVSGRVIVVDALAKRGDGDHAIGVRVLRMLGDPVDHAVQSLPRPDRALLNKILRMIKRGKYNYRNGKYVICFLVNNPDIDMCR